MLSPSRDHPSLPCKYFIGTTFIMQHDICRKVSGMLLWFSHFRSQFQSFTNTLNSYPIISDFMQHKTINTLNVYTTICGFVKHISEMFCCAMNEKLWSYIEDIIGFTWILDRRGAFCHLELYLSKLECVKSINRMLCSGSFQFTHVMLNEPVWRIQGEPRAAMHVGIAIQRWRWHMRNQ